MQTEYQRRVLIGCVAFVIGVATAIPATSHATHTRSTSSQMCYEVASVVYTDTFGFPNSGYLENSSGSGVTLLCPFISDSFAIWAGGVTSIDVDVHDQSSTGFIQAEACTVTIDGSVASCSSPQNSANGFSTLHPAASGWSAGAWANIQVVLPGTSGGARSELIGYRVFAP